MKRGVAAPSGTGAKKGKQEGKKAPAEASLESRVYSKLPDYVLNNPASSMPLETLPTDATTHVKSMVTGMLGVNNMNAEEEFGKKVGSKAVFMENPAEAKEEKKKKKKSKNALSKRAKASMPAKERRAKRLYDIPPDLRKYELYLPLHKLWLGYMADLLNVELDSALALTREGGATAAAAAAAPATTLSLGITPRLLKADYHGCHLQITRSTSPSMVGICGIVVQEFQNVFKIVTEANELKTVPKANSVFTFELGGHSIDLHGNQFRFRTAERSSRKFKTQSTLDL